MKSDLRPEIRRSPAALRVGFLLALALTTSSCTASSDSADTSRDVDQTSTTQSQSDGQSSPGTAVVPGGGSYISLAEYEAAKTSYAASKVVLFFNATWCSTCKEARSNLEADLSAIPADLVIVLVDFDSESDLKRQYGVTVQHTFVQVDADGTELAKWSGSVTAQEIVEKTV